MSAGDSAAVVRTRGGRFAASIVVVVLAAGVGVLSTVVSRLAWRPWAYLTVPWGLALGTLASAGIVVLAGGIARPLAFLAAAGWVAGVGLVVAGRPEGDFVLAQDWLGIGYLAVATAAVLGSALRRGSRP